MGRVRSETLASPLFRKILLSACALIVATVGSADYLVARYTAARETEQVQHEMELAGRILAGELRKLDAAGLGEWAKEADRQTRARVTVIGGDGAVLGESRRERGNMENHRGRPEVQAAMRGEVGAARRHSASLGVDFLYVAMPAPVAGEGGAVLRLAVPLERLDESLREVRLKILVTSVLLALAALVAAYWYARTLTGRIGNIQSYAESLAAERLSEGLELEDRGRDELGALAGSLRGMAGQLRAMVGLLEEESGRRESILEGMKEGVLAVDEGMRVTFCNEAFLRAVGRSGEVEQGAALGEVVVNPGFVSLLEGVVRGAVTAQAKLPLTPGAGRSFEVYAKRLGTGALAIVHDITELERLERVRKDFVANVSHELRTPLAAIRGYAETLLDGALEDGEYNRKFLEIIRSNAIRLTNIASDLLVLSEMEQDRAEPEAVEVVEVRAVAEAAVRTVESAARVRGVGLEMSCAAGLKVRAKRFRLEQAVVNLVDNAVKFSAAGGVVRVESEAMGEARVVVRVKDEGIGIPFEEQSRIFERFYRVDKARSREAGGTGLGLSIVKHIAEAYGGSVRVESRVGEGAEFTLEFPRA